MQMPKAPTLGGATSEHLEADETTAKVDAPAQAALFGYNGSVTKVPAPADGALVRVAWRVESALTGEVLGVGEVAERTRDLRWAAVRSAAIVALEHVIAERVANGLPANVSSAANGHRGGWHDVHAGSVGDGTYLTLNLKVFWKRGQIHAC